MTEQAARRCPEGRCAVCDRIAPDNPSVVATVAGEPLAYLCAACLPWDEDELFRTFEASVRERYAGLPLAFAFWPARGRTAGLPGDHRGA